MPQNLVIFTISPRKHAQDWDGDQSIYGISNITFGFNGSWMKGQSFATLIYGQKSISNFLGIPRLCSGEQFSVYGFCDTYET